MPQNVSSCKSFFVFFFFFLIAKTREKKKFKFRRGEIRTFDLWHNEVLASITEEA